MYPMQQQPLDPALIEQIFALQQQGPAQAQTARNRAMVDRMRADAAGQLQGRQVGAVYTPPTVFNVGAAFMQNRRARKLEDDAGVREQNAAAQRAAALRAFFGALTGGAQRQQFGHMGDEGE